MAATCGIVMPPGASNSTPGVSNTTDPSELLTRFLLPGIPPIVGYILGYLHIDPRALVQIFGAVSAVMLAWQYVEKYVFAWFEWFMCTAQMRPNDEMFSVISSWIASQSFSQSSKNFVVSVGSNANRRMWDPFFYGDDSDDEEAQDQRKLIYSPAPGTHYFWYKRRLLFLRRNDVDSIKGVEEISISVFGRDPGVLKALMSDAWAQYDKNSSQSKTVVYRGTMEAHRLDASWGRSVARSRREFSSVVLGEQVKRDLIEDMEDYLDPATSQWYSNRGIPYRRGYLLHGPPGTGKSSLSLALAGHFRLPIYIVSLSSRVATEENMAHLFGNLPRQCIVLLEDIDSAGLTHTRDRKSSDKDDTSDDSSDSSDGEARRKSPMRGSLSLSGLLNVLDGVASQEGRILVMTTNHPEKLDKALIRPGRVDMQVKFPLADKEMAASIFRCMYGHLEKEMKHEGDTCGGEREKEAIASTFGAGLSSTAPSATPSEGKASGKRPGDGSESGSSPEEKEAMKSPSKEEAKKTWRERVEEETARVEVLAGEFAAQVPHQIFSPAELQGFLLRHKRKPDAAVKQVAQWRDKAIEEKAEKERRKAKNCEKKRNRKSRKLKKSGEKRKPKVENSEESDSLESEKESETKGYRSRSGKRNKKAKKGKKSNKVKMNAGRINEESMEMDGVMDISDSGDPATFPVKDNKETLPETKEAAVDIVAKTEGKGPIAEENTGPLPFTKSAVVRPDSGYVTDSVP